MISSPIGESGRSAGDAAATETTRGAGMAYQVTASDPAWAVACRVP